jgi:hypothetical protein
MTIKDLYDILTIELREFPYHTNLQVKVLIAERSMPARAFSLVKDAYFGFDHDSGLLLLTEDRLVRKPKRKKKK